jgi:hypothetical protein
MRDGDAALHYAVASAYKSLKQHLTDESFITNLFLAGYKNNYALGGSDGG